MPARARLVPLALILAVVGSPAWADDKSDVLAANQAFERAFSSLDIKAIEAAWAHDGNVTVIHPISKTVVIGWDAVKKTWEGQPERYSQISVAMEEPRANVSGNVGWVVGVEKVRGTRRTGETVEFSVMTTNIYEKRDGRWLMVHHHGSRVPQ